MKIFFDTEFTGLHKDTTLISIGLVDENNRSLYIELSDYDRSQCDSWIRKNVLAHLVGINPMPRKKASEALEEWLSIYDKVELVSDCCHYDMVLFVDLFGGAFDIPENVCPACHDINQDIAEYLGISETEAFDYSREKLVEGFDIEGDKHNCLYDAKVIKKIYELINYVKNRE
jgi:hypothetical protein